MQKVYVPSQKILEKYAQVLINFALNSGKGLKKGEVVQLVVPDVAKPLAKALQNQVLKSGGHPLMRLVATGFDKDYYELANDDQLTFFPKKYLKEKVNLLDHQVVILADPYPELLKKVDPNKIMKSRNSKKPYMDWCVKKENQGKYTYTIALWGVQAKADIVNLSLKKYWDQIIKACYLDKKNPITQWQNIHKMQQDIKQKLNALRIEYLKVQGKDVDLKIKLGADRIWEGGSGRNIPSFELFTSPDFRDIEGTIFFNEPVYRYGNLIKDIKFTIKKGIVTKAKAQTGNKFLQAMLKTKNANKIGEFSLTDKRMSRITHPMAEILFDENIGGPFGNTHLAIGRAYHQCYRGNQNNLTPQQWLDKGFNDSSEHTDLISTTDRTVTAILTDQTKKIIYKDGKFVV